LSQPLPTPCFLPQGPCHCPGKATHPKSFPLQRNPQPVPLRILKKWKWSGKLFFEGQESNPVCNVTLCDANEPSGIRFNFFIDNWDRLVFPSFHDIVDLDSVLVACKPPTHIARLAPADPQDYGPMTTLSIHIVKYRKVCPNFHYALCG
jgi:hypothetical protein